ncbi:flagellin [Salinibaculum rarum]|uniref:flagellin n=1 Tax=Salinibaculum rarum TaxID=3058903 RepID=UPI00265DF788|nr:flagellin [Salinibaculum sp. KK48]
MGFGTSGSAFIIFAALLLGISSFYTATANSTETIREAQDARDEHHRTVLNTGVNVTNATYNTSSSNFTLRVTNTGETTLSTDRVDAVLEDAYLDSSDFERVTVDGQATRVWHPGEQLVLEDDDTVADLTETPGRVKFVSGPGVADTRGVTEVSA